MARTPAWNAYIRPSCFNCQAAVANMQNPQRACGANLTDFGSSTFLRDLRELERDLFYAKENLGMGKLADPSEAAAHNAKAVEPPKEPTRHPATGKADRPPKIGAHKMIKKRRKLKNSSECSSPGSSSRSPSPPSGVHELKMTANAVASRTSLATPGYRYEEDRFAMHNQLKAEKLKPSKTKKRRPSRRTSRVNVYGTWETEETVRESLRGIGDVVDNLKKLAEVGRRSERQELSNVIDLLTDLMECLNMKHFRYIHDKLALQTEVNGEYWFRK